MSVPAYCGPAIVLGTGRGLSHFILVTTLRGAYYSHFTEDLSGPKTLGSLLEYDRNKFRNQVCLTPEPELFALPGRMSVSGGL